VRRERCGASLRCLPQCNAARRGRRARTRRTRAVRERRRPGAAASRRRQYGARASRCSSARVTCAPVRSSAICLDWLRQLDDVAPTVVFAAKEEQKDLTDVKVTMDGQPLHDESRRATDSRRILRKAHVPLRARRTDAGCRVVIAPGRRPQHLVTFGATPPPPPPPPPGRREERRIDRAPPWAESVLLRSASNVLRLSGKSAVDDLDGKPKCPQATSIPRDEAHRRRHLVRRGRGRDRGRRCPLCFASEGRR